MSRRGGNKASAPDHRLLFDNVTELPMVPLLIGKMKNLLSSCGQLGLVTVNIVQEQPLEQSFGWRRFDRLMREVAEFLEDFKTRHLRREDDVADMMVNGNAFVILLSPPRDRPRMERADLERTRERIRDPLRSFLVSRLPARFADCFGCYVGCALVDHDPNQRPERTIYRALDLSLGDSAGSKAHDREDREGLLRQVLAQRQVTPVYQPVVDLAEQRVIGYEALSRVPEGLFRNTEQLFQVAQEANATWELERLCREIAIRGVGEYPDKMFLFLNVEPDSIYDPQFRSQETLDMLARAGLQPDRVVLEMTEHSGVQDFQAFRKTLEHFRSQGFRLAIDDVGSGYSGLQSIAEVRPDFIKIDMSLIRDVHRHDIKRDLVQTIGKFSAMSGISMIAEGVETVEELRELRRIGVVLAQGYLFARPRHPLPEVKPESMQ